MLWRCWLGGRKGIWPVKIPCWGVWARCRFANCPSDATATHCLLRQSNPDWFSYRLTRVILDRVKRAVKQMCVHFNEVGISWKLLVSDFLTNIHFAWQYAHFIDCWMLNVHAADSWLSICQSTAWKLALPHVWRSYGTQYWVRSHKTFCINCCEMWSTVVASSTLTAELALEGI